MKKIMLPESEKSDGSASVIDVPDSLVIIGANGSGKSRLGAWIEQHHQQSVKRISALRLLQIPEYAPLKSLEQSTNELINSWRNRSVIEFQNDYESVLSTLFAKTSKRDSEYVALCKGNDSKEKPEIPESAIEKLIRIWSEVLPHRQLHIEDSKVNVKSMDGLEYSGREMSDGERVALYLIAQCLCVPENSLIIVDEPEIHLHRALMSRLWNCIEEERKDVLFIYITHDLDFASSRVKATKIWVKNYVNNCWTWEYVPSLEGIPDNICLEIIGSRKPVIFVEGEKGSYDNALYQYRYPHFTIIPRGGCEKVIESAKAFVANEKLHDLKAYGLVDLDNRTPEEIAILEKNNIKALAVGEVENLFIIEDVLSAVSRHLVLEPNDIVGKAKDIVFTKMAAEKDMIISYKTSITVNFILNNFDQKQIGKENIEKAIARLASTINVEQIYEKNNERYEKILSTKNYDAALSFYTNKGLMYSISPLVGMKGNEYASLVIRLMRTKEKVNIVKGLERYVPNFA